MDPTQNAKLQMLHQCWAVGQWERMEMLGRELLVPTPSIAESRHRKTLGELSRGEGEEDGAGSTPRGYRLAKK